jgi:hypothetical protein
MDHLLLSCVFSREYWFKLLRCSSLQALTSAPGEDRLLDWWLKGRKTITKGYVRA